MRAAVLYRPREPLAVEDVELDPPRAGEVRVRIAATGVCHSDISYVDGTLPYALPVVLGHEGAGVVEVVGEGVSDLSPGDHVVLSVVPSCGECRACVSGKGNLCSFVPFRREGRMPDGSVRMHGRSGDVHHFVWLSTFAEEVVVPRIACVKVAGDLPLESLCLIGCGVATGVMAALNTAQVRPGSTVAVFGCGGVGLNVVQGAVLAGAARVIAVDPVGRKRTWARELGATDEVDPLEGDPVEAVRDLTRGGADYTFEVVGRPEIMAQALEASAEGGTCTIVGVPAPGTVIEVPHALLRRDRRLLGTTMGGTRIHADLPLLVDLYRAGRLKLDELVTRRLPLDGINEAIAAVEAGEVARTVLVNG